MGEIRIVGPGKSCGYHYPVCKKMSVLIPSLLAVNFSMLFGCSS